jgi:hypothetical protein
MFLRERVAHCVVRISAFAAFIIVFTGTSTIPATVHTFPLITDPAGASIEFASSIRCPFERLSHCFL